MQRFTLALFLIVCLLLGVRGGQWAFLRWQGLAQRLARTVRDTPDRPHGAELRRLAALGPEGTAQLGGLLPVLGDTDFNVAVHLLLDTPELLDRGRQMLPSPDARRHYRAGYILARVGTSRDLAAVLKGYSKSVEAPAFLNLLVLAGKRNPEILIALNRKTDDPRRRVLIWKALRLLRAPEAVPLIRQAMLETTNREMLIAGTETLLDIDPRGLDFLLHSFACHPLREEAIPVLLRDPAPIMPLLLAYQTPAEERIASWKLELLGQAAPDEARSVFKEALESGDKTLVQPTLEAIIKTATPMPNLERNVLPLLTSSDEPTLLLAMRAVGVLKADAAIDRLVWLLNTGEFDVRRQAALTLAQLGGRSAANLLRKRYYRERNFLLQRLIFELLVNQNNIKADREPVGDEYCYCGEWGATWCQKKRRRFCSVHLPKEGCGVGQAPAPATPVPSDHFHSHSHSEMD